MLTHVLVAQTGEGLALGVFSSRRRALRAFFAFAETLKVTGDPDDPKDLFARHPGWWWKIVALAVDGIEEPKKPRKKKIEK